jgi:septin 7
MLIRSYMEELREYTNHVLYERYRTEKLNLSGGVKGLVTAAGDSNTLAQLEQSKLAHDQKMAKMEAEMKAVFQQKVAEKEAKLKQSEAELYARHKEMKEQLDRQRSELDERLKRLDNSRPTTPSSEGKSWKKTSLFK